MHGVLSIHCNFHRLSDNTYQTAKISLVLLLVNEGVLEKYKGLGLKNINIDLNVMTENCDLDDIISEQPYDMTNTSHYNATQKVNLDTNNKKTSIKLSCITFIPGN